MPLNNLHLKHSITTKKKIRDLKEAGGRLGGIKKRRNLLAVRAGKASPADRQDIKDAERQRG